MHLDREQFWALVHKKLSGEASANELQALEDLLRAYPELHYVYESLTDVWALEAKPTAEAGEAYNRHLERLQLLDEEEAPAESQPVAPAPREFSFFKKQKWYALAALSAVVVFAAVFFIHNSAPGLIAKADKRTTSEILARPGATTKISLPDGSLVWLNAGSKLTYTSAFDEMLREVTLEGEGYFDVVSKPKKPFIVHTAALEVKVLGTIFNIKSFPGEATTEASLIEGSIQAVLKERPEETIVLKPHEKIIVQNHSTARQEAHPATLQEAPIIIIDHLRYQQDKDSTLIETAWIQNKFIFRDEAFAELAARMERWYGVSIVFEDEAVKKLRFTGSFQRENLEQALKALKITGQFHYQLKDDVVFISSKK